MPQNEPGISDREGFSADTWLFTYRVDLQGEPRLSEVSPTIEESLGYEPSELVGRPGRFGFLHPEETERFASFLSDPPESGTKEMFRLEDPSGETVRGRHTFRPIRGDEGSIEGLECVVYQRPADWELPYDAIVDAINEGILIVRFDGEIVYVNARMAAMLGYTPDEMVGAMLFDFMSEKWAERARRNLERREKGVEEVFDHQFVHKEGHSVWTLVATKPMPEARGFRGSLVAIRDISRRKRMEKELQEARDELEERVAERTEQLRKTNATLEQEVRERREAEKQALAASRAKSVFLATMSHELRTPLNAVIGYTELLREDFQRAAEGESLDFDRMDADLAKIEKGAHHLLDLIGDILDLSKAEAGKIELEQETFQFEALLDEVAEATRPVIEENDNALVVELEESGEGCTDRTKLKQILINLVGNAGKFTEGGTVTMSAESVEYERRPAVRIDVRDTGIGMESSELEELFEPFTQADQSTTREYGGTGLGLTICRRFTEVLGGELNAESEPGVGSRFTVVVPIDGELGGTRRDLRGTAGLADRATERRLSDADRPEANGGERHEKREE